MTDAGCDMVRIRRLCKICRVAHVAVGICQFEIAVGMTRLARGCEMLPGENKLGRTVAKCRR
jgi:hypothetical protein